MQDLKESGLQIRSPLGTPEQLETEKKMLWVVQQPEIKAAVARGLELVLADSRAQTPDGRRLGERAVSKWLGHLTMDSLNRARAIAAPIWKNQITPYAWFGHSVMGQSGAVDNLDFVYRILTVDGDAEYQLHATVRAPYPTAAFQITDCPGGRQGFSVRRDGVYDVDSIAQFDEKDIRRDADGSFTLSFGPSPANGRTNHVTTPPRRLQIIIRELLNDWAQHPAHMQVTRLDGRPESAALSDREAMLKIAGDFEHYVKFWLDYGSQYAGNPAPNVVIGPYERNGGWSSAAVIRTLITPGQAAIITVNEANADYAGIQITDNWLIAPSALRHSCSFTRSQSVRNTDGSYSYIVSIDDPGAANWLDNAKQADGFVMLRWAGLPPNIGKLIEKFEVVDMQSLWSHIDPVQKITPEARRAQLQKREATWKLRLGAW